MNQEEVLQALAVVIKSAKSPSSKLLVEYPLWEKLSFEARQEALNRFREFKDMLMLGYSWNDVIEMVNSSWGEQI